ncbi:MAG: response regulator [Deltaproteobacteria bacterium]|nr:response regulator [Deltaproteobacteria bacterium]
MSVVLIVDDNTPLAEDLAEILADAGHRTETACSGEDAIRRVLRGGIDILVLDLRMPGMGGIEALRRLRQTGVSVPAIAMTAFADEATKVHGIEAGIRAVLDKPVDYARLETLINQIAA